MFPGPEPMHFYLNKNMHFYPGGPWNVNILLFRDGQTA